MGLCRRTAVLQVYVATEKRGIRKVRDRELKELIEWVKVQIPRYCPCCGAKMDLKGEERK